MLNVTQILHGRLQGNLFLPHQMMNLAMQTCLSKEPHTNVFHIEVLLRSIPVGRKHRTQNSGSGMLENF
ncbi:hypothetical protein DPMN_093545 [Dreissena polymorpha]|uniref:Uncharacterized protein n=1 Tax=Dreissena polymorpha TaxID=45954 RepID=A0A9D4L5P8_DREPO|nr:hypothetical protein DPMN_093545 [Dreissena polymorpha]